MKKLLAVLLCTVVLLTGLMPAQAIKAEEVYFTAVNDKLLPLSMDTMPIWVGGAIYVPASAFDSNSTGVNLGIYCSRSNISNTFTIYDLRRMLVFDLSGNGSFDQTAGEQLDSSLVQRGGRVFLPLEDVCDFFELQASYTYTRYGYLVRIKNNSAALTDAVFVDAASAPMSRNLKEFLKANTPVTPKPPAPVTPSEDEPIDPPDDPEPDQPKAQVRLYLAFRCQSGEGLEGVLDRLEQEGVRALFLLDPELLTGQDDLVRRIVGTGHTIGLLTEEEGADELERGNELLGHIARTAATVVSAPEGKQETLEAAGWVCWRQTVNGVPRGGERESAYAARLISAIGSRSRTVYLTMDDSARMPRLLDAALDRFREQEYTLMVPLENRL